MYTNGAKHSDFQFKCQLKVASNHQINAHLYIVSEVLTIRHSLCLSLWEDNILTLIAKLYPIFPLKFLDLSLDQINIAARHLSSQGQAPLIFIIKRISSSEQD